MNCVFKPAVDYTNYTSDWNSTSTLWSEIENQQDATVSCLLSILSQHVSGIVMPIFCVLAPYNAAPHNRYQPHPAEPAQHTTCSNTRLVLLKMDIMMPETCWESIDNKHLTAASCWFSISLHSLLTMHGHRNLKLKIKIWVQLTEIIASVPKANKSQEN